MEIKRGSIVYLHGRENDPRMSRPFVIVSNNVGNYFGSIVLGVPLTTRHKKITQPTHCIIDYHESMVMAEQIHTIDKQDIDKIVYRLDDYDMRQIDECLEVSLGLVKGYDRHG